MAGIGFELKKIYRKEGISRALLGALYSSVVTIGPTILIIVVILLLYLILRMTSVGVYEREVLSSTILYVFIFSVCLTSPFNSIFSRYLADKFYMEEYDDILSSYYTGLLLVSAIAMIMGLPMMLSMYFRGGLDLLYILISFVFWASAVILFFSITYLHATKDYKIIAIFYLGGMLIGAAASLILYFLVGWNPRHAIITGLALAFLLIAISEFTYIRHYFKGTGSNYSECLRYIWRYREIFLTNLFYILGLYVHNFYYWTIPGRLVVANTFISHMNYDMATCLAMFTNISTTIIFTVIAETRFHETYQDYMESVIGGTYRKIQKTKSIMFRVLSQQLGQVFSLQIAITCIIFLVLIIFGTRIGFGSMTMQIYPVLAVSYLGVFVMYCNIIYLYYFEDTVGSMLTGLIFLGVTFGCTIFASRLPVMFYGAGLFVGMLSGWIFSYLRLRHVERNFDAHIFCRYKIINTMKSSEKGIVVYSRDNA